MVDLFQKELTEFTCGDFDVVFATGDRVYADGSAEGVRRAVGQLRQEPIDLLGGGAMWESMAIAIIFGLLFASLLT